MGPANDTTAKCKQPGRIKRPYLCNLCVRPSNFLHNFCTPSPSLCFIFGEPRDSRPLSNRRADRKAKLTTVLAALGFVSLRTGFV